MNLWVTGIRIAKVSGNQATEHTFVNIYKVDNDKCNEDMKH